MATNFPTSLDSFTNPAPTDTLDSVTVPHAAQHDNINDAVAALEAKVGVNSSAVTTSLDYIVNHLPAAAGSGADIASAVGCTTIPRGLATTAIGFGSGFMTMVGFVPQVSYTAANIKIVTTTSVVIANGYVAIYSVDASGNLTRVAVSANDITLGNSGAHTTALATPVALTAGTAYVVAANATGATLSVVTNAALAAGVSRLTLRPWAAGFVAAGGVTIPPTSIAIGAITVLNQQFYAEVTV